MTLELIQGLLLAFALVVILMPPYIRLLRHFRLRQADPRGGAREPHGQVGDAHDGRPPRSSSSSSASSSSCAGRRRAASSPRSRRSRSSGLLGAVDDYLNARTGEGIRVRQKLLWQTVVARVRRVADPEHVRDHRHPGAVRRRRGHRPVALRRVRARSRSWPRRNGVNITDGLDGLAGGTLVFAFVVVPDHRAAQRPGPAEPRPPVRADHRRAARASCGSTSTRRRSSWATPGSLSLGATLAVIALITGQILVLPLIGLIFVIETMSDIIQVGYFKLSGGKRIFRMAPLHHHFELGGWDEEKITLRFWIVGILAGLLGVTLFLASIDALAVTTMTTTTGRPRRPHARRRARGRARRPAGDGPRARPQRRSRSPGSSTTGRPGHGLRRPRRGRARAGDRAARRAGRSTLRLGPGRGPGVDLGGRRAGRRRRRRSRPTTRRPSRASGRAPGARRGARRRRPDAPALVSRVGPVPAAVPRADDRRHRDEGQDHDARPRARDPRRGPAPPGGPRRQHRDAAGGAAARADARPPGRRRAVRAAAADPVARHDGRGLHQRDLGPPRPPRHPSRPTGGSSAGSPSWSTRTARSCSTSRTRSSAAYAGLGTAPAVLYRDDRPVPGGLGVRRRLDRRRGGGAAAARRRRHRARRARAAGSCRSTSSASPGAHNVSNALAAIAVGLLFGIAPDAIRRAAAAFTGVEHRLQTVALVDGVRFVNDSQGTQPDAVIAALRAFPAAGRADRRRPRQGRRPRGARPAWSGRPRRPRS